MAVTRRQLREGDLQCWLECFGHWRALFVASRRFLLFALVSQYRIKEA